LFDYDQPGENKLGLDKDFPSFKDIIVKTIVGLKPEQRIPSYGKKHCYNKNA
jgi:hypothetical protein